MLERDWGLREGGKSTRQKETKCVEKAKMATKNFSINCGSCGAEWGRLWEKASGREDGKDFRDLLLTGVPLREIKGVGGKAHFLPRNRKTFSPFS